MSPSGPMLAQDIVFFGQGIYLLIGILVFLLFAGVAGMAIYVAIRVWIFQVRQRRSQEAYLKRTRRADGKAYPPRSGGICEKCGRVRKVVFFLPTGEMLCPECYEAWWPIEEARVADDDSISTVKADRDATAPQTPLARNGDRKPAPV